MEFEMLPYKVLVRVDDAGRVVEINSSAFITDMNGWTEIDCGTGDRYHHAQGNYLDNSLYTDDGVPRYKLVDGSVVDRTPEEIADDVAAIPSPPDQGDYDARIAQLEDELMAAKILLGVE